MIDTSTSNAENRFYENEKRFYDYIAYDYLNIYYN